MTEKDSIDVAGTSANWAVANWIETAPKEQIDHLTAETIGVLVANVRAALVCTGISSEGKQLTAIVWDDYLRELPICGEGGGLLLAEILLACDNDQLSVGDIRETLHGLQAKGLIGRT
jgi:hypothetical protein